jgi:hypothetical protein
MCSPSPITVMPPNERKILDWRKNNEIINQFNAAKSIAIVQY